MSPTGAAWPPGGSSTATDPPAISMRSGSFATSGRSTERWVRSWPASAPMVLAAVEHLVPVWRHASTYPHLVDETLAGNPEGLGSHELHAGAWAVVEPLFL